MNNLIFLTVYCKINSQRAPIAQLDRVAHYECDGLGFESLWVYQSESLEI